MSAHVAITGATGFIGAAVAAEFLALGTEVTLLLRADSDRTRLAELAGVEFLTYTKLDDSTTIAALAARRPCTFIHCGWKGVVGGERNAAFQITANLPLTLAAVELAAAAGCQHWIGFGSQAEYGNANRRLDEDAPLRPTTIYGKAKLAAGIAALALCETRALAGTWLRVFSTYGPGDDPAWFIPYVTQELIAGRAPRLTRCEQRWDYLYVGDAARAVVAITKRKAGGIFNLGSGQARPLRDCVEAIRSELHSAVEPVYGAIPYRADQVMHLEAEITRLSAATGWSPETNIQTGLRATVAAELLRTRTAVGSIPPISFP